MFYILLYSSFSLFSLQYAVAPRILSSFPTRRSSDLPAGKDFCLKILTFTNLALYKLSPTIKCISRYATTEHSPAEGDTGYRDRKSTRLNSSHRCISYAVFFL